MAYRAEQAPFRDAPPWPVRCRPFPPHQKRPGWALPPAERDADRGRGRRAVADDQVISLHEAARRIGLLVRTRRNWNATLLKRCAEAGIDVRRDPAKVPCIRSSDLPALERAVRAKLRPRRVRRPGAAGGNPATRPMEGRGSTS